MGEPQHANNRRYPEAGALVARLRHERGYRNQTELADAVADESGGDPVTKSAVSRWESGERPEHKHVVALDHVLEAGGDVYNGFYPEGGTVVKGLPTNQDLLDRIEEVADELRRNEQKAHRKIKDDLKRLVADDAELRVGLRAAVTELTSTIHTVNSTMQSTDESMQAVEQAIRRLLDRMPPLEQPQSAQPAGTSRRAPRAPQPTGRGAARASRRSAS